MSVTLKSLSAERVIHKAVTPIFGDVLTVTTESEVVIDGINSPGWKPMTEGVPLCAVLDGSQIFASVQSPYGDSAPISNCSVSPFEPLWKLNLPFICTNPEIVPAADRGSLGRISLRSGKLIVQATTSLLPSRKLQEDLSEIQGDESSAPQELHTPSAVGAAETPAAMTIGRSTARILGAGRAGSFEYEETGETNVQWVPAEPLEHWTNNRLTGTFHLTFPNRAFSWGGPGTMRQPSFPATVSLKFRASRPHVAILLTDAGDRFPMVLINDSSGKPLEGELFNIEGILIWLAKEADDEIQEVEVTLLLQKPRVFSFVVPPPKVLPLLNNVAK